MQSIIKRQWVRVEESGDCQAASSASGISKGGAIRLLEAGGEVAGIELVCACGRRSVVEFEYQEAAHAEKP
jgi:hypothetical protein